MQDPKLEVLKNQAMYCAPVKGFNLITSMRVKIGKFEHKIPRTRILSTRIWKRLWGMPSVLKESCMADTRLGMVALRAMDRLRALSNCNVEHITKYLLR